MTELEYAHADDIYSSGMDLRHGWDGFQQGVLGAGDWKVTTGAGLSVDVAAGVAFIAGTAVPDQGLYRCRNDAAKNSSAFELGGIAPNGSSNPRLDQIVARAYDPAHDGGALRKWRFEVKQGTATFGATLDNGAGAFNLASLMSVVLIADVLVPAGNPSSIPSGNIRDRRPACRGARRSLRLTSGDRVRNYTSGFGPIHDFSLHPRVECSGRPVLLSLRVAQLTADADAYVDLAAYVDGGSAGQGAQTRINADEAQAGVLLERELAMSSGSHKIAPYWSVSPTGGSTPNATLLAHAGYPLDLSIRELMQEEVNND